MPLDSKSLKPPAEEPMSAPPVEEPEPPPAQQPAVEKKQKKQKKDQPKAKAKSEPSVYVAIESGVAEYKGESATFVKGVTRVQAGHWLLRRVKHAFEPAEEHLHYRSDETAVAAPRGE